MIKDEAGPSDNRLAPVRQMLTSATNVNNVIRDLAVSHDCAPAQVAVVFDLAGNLPQTRADFEQVAAVLFALIANAKTQALRNGGAGSRITIKSSLKAERIQVSVTYREPFAGWAYEPRDPLSATPLDLKMCAEIIQEQMGELYAWRSHKSECTVLVDLPADVTAL